MKGKFNLTKRFLSFLLVLSMIFGMMSTVSFAAWDTDEYNFANTNILIPDTNENNMPYLETVLVEVVDTAVDGNDCYIKEVTPSTVNVGDTIIVAIKAHNFDRFTDNAYGVSKLSTSLVYDTRYLTSSTTSKKAFLNRTKELLAEAGSSSFYNDDSIAGSYSVETYAFNQSMNSGETSTLSSDNSNLLKGVISISCTPDDDTNDTEQLGVINEGSYVAFYEYTVKAKPEDGTFSAAVSMSRSNNMVVALRNTAPNINLTYTANDGLHCYMRLVDGVDLFPVSYSLNFYDDPKYSNKLAGFGKTGIAENTAMSDLGITAPVAGKDFPKTITGDDGKTKYFSELKYIDASGTAKSYSSLTTITAAAADKNGDGTEIRVYPDYADGQDITFHSEYPSGSGLIDTTKVVTVSSAAGTYFTSDDEPTVGTSGTVDFTIPSGYSLEGWYTGKGGTGTKVVFDGSTTSTSGVPDVYANWQAMYTVKFYQKEGDSNEIKTALQFDPSDSDANKTITSSVLPTDSERGTISGKRFDGWYYKVGTSGTETKFEDSTSLVVDDNVVIYGKWVDVVTVSFYDSKTDLVAASSWEVDKGKKVADLTVSQTIPTKTDNDSTHKYFIGWKNKNDDSAVNFTDSTYTFNADLDVYADYGNYYEIKYYDDAKDGSPSQFGSTVYVNPNSNNKNPVVTASDIPSTPPTSTDPDKGFSKWVYYVSGNKTDFDAGVSVTGNIDVYPEWADLISIKFDYNGGTLDSAYNKTLKIKPSTSIGSADNGSLSAPVPTRTYGGHNYILKGWAASANSQTPDYTTDTINSNVFAAGTTLYAVWAVDPDSDPNDLATLTFDSVGGSSVSPITVYKGDTITAAQMPSNPTKGQYTFIDWFEAATLSNTTHVTAPITMSADKTAYAHWDYTAADAITITFNDNGATTAVSPTSIKIAPNDSIGAAWPTDPAKTDNTFGGWYTDTSNESTKKTSSSTFATNTILNAKWIADITVTYDTNGGNPDGPGTVKKPAGDTYVDPTPIPTKNGVVPNPDYTFLGWNTEKNGSGTYIKAGNKPDTSVPLKYEDLVTGGATSVTLYAQWGAYDPENGPDAKQKAVTVTFDGNGTTQRPVTKEANPKNKYPQLGDSIGTDNMPNNPERTDYKFKEWNTKADGTGTKVDGSTVFDASLDGVTAVGDGTYTSTVYAQWTPATTATTVTVTFNKNTDGTGNAADDVDTLSIVSGDSLGAAMPADPTNGTYAFKGWYAGSVTDGKLTTSGDALTSSTPISADTTYYAKWTKMLVARMQTNTAVYTGQAINPLFDIYEISYPDTQQPYVLGKQIASGIDPTTNPDYKITYYKGDPSVTEVKDVGSYSFKVDLKDTSALAIAGAAVSVTDYEENNSRTSAFTVTPKLLTVKVDPDTQIQKAGTTVSPATVKIEGLAITDAEANVIEKKYSKWNPADDSDTTIEKSELDDVTTPTEIAKYVLQVTVKSDNKNYKIDKVDSSKNGTPVLLYEKNTTSTYPAFNILNTDGNIVPGTNIVYVIQANDPSASSVVVKSADTKDDEGNAKDPEVVTNLSLKQSDYKTDETFDNAEKPTTKEYYVRVTDVGAEEVRFTITLTNPDTTSLTATGGTAVKNADGTYTVTAPLTSKGATPNVVEITTKAGTETDAPTITYKFNVQQLVEAKIVLNYGNSPYGEIMRATNITDKDAAKTAFNTGNMFTSSYLPVGRSTKIYYSLSAWGGSTDPSVNLDRNDTALFAFEYEGFTDPGFTATNALGQAVTGENITRSIKVCVLPDKDMKVSITEDMFKTYTTDGDTTHDVFTNADLTGGDGKSIQPDVYELTYSFYDSVLDDTVSVTRKVAIAPIMGDTNLDGLLSVGDLIPIKNFTANNFTAVDSSVKQSTYNLFTYRVMDTSADEAVSVGDLIPIKNATANMSIDTYYSTFTKN